MTSFFDHGYDPHRAASPTVPFSDAYRATYGQRVSLPYQSTYQSQFGTVEQFHRIKQRQQQQQQYPHQQQQNHHELDTHRSHYHEYDDENVDDHMSEAHSYNAGDEAKLDAETTAVSNDGGGELMAESEFVTASGAKLRDQRPVTDSAVAGRSEKQSRAQSTLAHRTPLSEHLDDEDADAVSEHSSVAPSTARSSPRPQIVHPHRPLIRAAPSDIDHYHRQCDDDAVSVRSTVDPGARSPPEHRHRYQMRHARAGARPRNSLIGDDGPHYPSAEALSASSIHTSTHTSASASPTYESSSPCYTASPASMRPAGFTRLDLDSINNRLANVSLHSHEHESVNDSDSEWRPSRRILTQQPTDPITFRYQPVRSHPLSVDHSITASPAETPRGPVVRDPWFRPLDSDPPSSLSSTVTSADTSPTQHSRRLSRLRLLKQKIDPATVTVAAGMPSHRPERHKIGNRGSSGTNTPVPVSISHILPMASIQSTDWAGKGRARVDSYERFLSEESKKEIKHSRRGVGAAGQRAREDHAAVILNEEQRELEDSESVELHPITTLVQPNNSPFQWDYGFQDLTPGAIERQKDAERLQYEAELERIRASQAKANSQIRWARRQLEAGFAPVPVRRVM